MKEVIRVEDQYYILAAAAHDEHSRVLKDDDTFALFDRSGNIRRLGRADQGIYRDGTRFLSRLDLRVCGLRPLLLSSAVAENNAIFAVDLTNPDLTAEDGAQVRHGEIHIFRVKFLSDGVCHERLRVHNHGLVPVSLRFALEFEADFLDIFEVRGMQREQRGGPPTAAVAGETTRWVYTGLDDVTRVTQVRCSGAEARFEPGTISFPLTLQPHEERDVYLTVECLIGEPSSASASTGSPPPYDLALASLGGRIGELEATQLRVRTSNAGFNEWLERSAADLRLLESWTEHGLYPYAGVPWYSTPFGRDGIITALQALWFQPSLARGVLRFLAATQATELDASRDAEPGKILHELRGGEMAALGEVPFGRYYGTVDATPLFLMLASEYHRATGDRALIEELWPHLELAVSWISDFGDADGDGLLDYAVKAERGLTNQGWKDSWDSSFHADGRLIDPPIALCEVQGYAYAGLLGMASLAQALGHEDRARLWRTQAMLLRERFEDAFWCEELSTYALALDGNKQPCRVRASNAGHCLYTGIASEERARRTTDTLMSDAFFSGWGIRTVAAGEVRYNPMSYHNGTIWPHDNALIAAGFARYGFKDESRRVFESMFEASATFEQRRLPELYCGFSRRSGEGPTSYPVACSPQAWASGTVLMTLGACLGLQPDAPTQTLRLCRPVLPEWLERVVVEGLQVGSATVDLAFHRYAEGGAGVDVLRRQGELEVLIVK